MLGIACTIVHGANTWYSSKERDVSTMANGDAALADLSYWVNNDTGTTGRTGDGHPAGCQPLGNRGDTAQYGYAETVVAGD